MGEKMDGIVNKVQESPFIQAALVDVQPFKQQDAIQRKLDEIKNYIRDAENNIAKAIINKFGFPNNVEHQVMDSENHIRYIDLCSCDLLTEINVKYSHNNSYIIQIYESDTLKG